MKKIFISILASLCVASTAIAQIPNSGFENWTNLGSYSNPDGWGTLNNTTVTAGVYTATKGTPGSPGTAYLKLTSKTVSGLGVVNGIAVSGVLDSITMQPKSGFAFSQRPASFTGKWQHMIYGSSQGSINVSLTRWDNQLNQRVVVATANRTLSGMAMSWANFTINFTYLDGNYPDTCIIVLKASGTVPTNNDYLWVDNFAFSGSVVGLNNENSIASNLTMFPNPSNGTVNLKINVSNAQQVKADIVDINGKLIRTVDFPKTQGEALQSIDLYDIAKGIYFVKIFGEGVIETRKLIIE